MRVERQMLHAAATAYTVPRVSKVVQVALQELMRLVTIVIIALSRHGRLLLGRSRDITP